ncbi:CPBP family intramembrane metalloprotease [Ornithinimicrobium ciconiae]|uniref:CPBP family intramembrane metalloprotease n=1 Tax=Ornithinimicrobium ciconiae TaxID=2594265 RepID=A0A516G605_9MICO|nr:CPBP family intramembrane glutamic endopeptidase [Ornithinimicrobium ciconiae]QDO86956.1 CPBP family intramembrane metalloprotease [Ornithinimicrobium ciconiae]
MSTWAGSRGATAYAEAPGQSGPRPSVRRRVLATCGVALALGVTNVLAAPRLGRAASMTWNLGTTAVVLGLGRWAGVDRTAVGLDPRRLRAGLATGAAGSAALALLLGAVSATTTGRELLDDDRVVDASWAQTLAHVGIFIPLGTVVLEEVAFRGALPALLDPDGRSVPLTVAVPSLAFGAWHVVSSRAFVAAHGQDNDPDRPGGAAAGSTAGIVAATAVAGLVLGLARRRGGHLAAPALMHLTANALATVVGRWVGRHRRR